MRLSLGWGRKGEDLMRGETYESSALDLLVLGLELAILLDLINFITFLIEHQHLDNKNC